MTARSDMRPIVGVIAAALLAANFGWRTHADAEQRAQQPRDSHPTGIPAGDWQTINRDPSANRYSPLKQINAGNVTQLRRAWTYGLGGGATAVPLVVNGVMYVPSGNRVVALDGASGKEIWVSSVPAAPPPGLGGGRGAARAGAAPSGPPAPTASARGVGYWPGDGSLPARILFMSGTRLIAVE